MRNTSVKLLSKALMKMSYGDIIRRCVVLFKASIPDQAYTVNFQLGAWKLSIFSFFLVRIFQHLDWILDLQSKSPYSVRTRENADQNNSEYGHFSRREGLFGLRLLLLVVYLIPRFKWWKNSVNTGRLSKMHKVKMNYFTQVNLEILVEIIFMKVMPWNLLKRKISAK